MKNLKLLGSLALGGGFVLVGGCTTSDSQDSSSGSGGSDAIGGDGSGGEANVSTGGSKDQASGGASSSSGGSEAAIRPNTFSTGDTCDTPGAAACAIDDPKLLLQCSAEGSWEGVSTCPGPDVCEFADGENLGQCVPPDEACLSDREEPFCLGNYLVSCSEGGLLVGEEECDLCFAGECVANECGATSESYINCDDECGEVHASCVYRDDIDCLSSVEFEMSDLESVLVRLPSSDKICGLCGAFSVVASFGESKWLKSVSEGDWTFYNSTNICGAKDGRECIVEEKELIARYSMYADEGEILPAQHVGLEIADATATCR